MFTLRGVQLLLVLGLTVVLVSARPDHHGHHHEEGHGDESHEDHHHEHGDKGHKGYEGHHEHEKGMTILLENKKVVLQTSI